MVSKLKNYFPLIREREELLSEIKENPKLREIYEEWSSEKREEFLDFCTRIRGMKVLYDSFFKEVMNPEYTPERLEELLCVAKHGEAVLGGQVGSRRGELEANLLF